MNPHALLLKEFYVRCRSHFGYSDPWWPGAPAEVFVTAILVQQCDWAVAWRGAQNLTLADLIEIDALAEASWETVQSAIRNVNLAPTKARRLVAIARRLRDRCDCLRFSELFDSVRSDLELRRELLGCIGVGPETADSILAFASNRAAFIVDEACRRVFERLNLFPGIDATFWRAPYSQVQRFFVDLLEPHLDLYDDLEFPAHLPRATAIYRDFHAQILELARHHCHKTSPRCHSSGKHGWSDYAICLPHCPPGECLGCPMASRCLFAGSPPPPKELQ